MKRLMDGKLKYLVVLLVLASLAPRAVAADFDPDKILQDPGIRKEVQKINSDTAAKQFFDAHSQAFGISKTMLDFLHNMSGGEYVKQVEAIMSVPVQKWNMHKGLMGGYDIIKVKQIVNQNQSVSITSRINKAAGHAANGLAVISIMMDIRAGLNGDDTAKLKAVGGTVELVKGYMIGKYGGAAMGAAMMGPAVIGIALSSFMSQAQAQYTEYWWQAYNSYLNKKYPKLVQGERSWVALSRSQGYDGMRRRLYEFWDNPYANAAEYYGKAGIQTAPGMAERTLKDAFAAEYYRNYIHTTLKTYYMQQADKARAAAYIRAMRAYNELKGIVGDVGKLMAAIKDAENFLEDDIEELILVPATAELKTGQTIAFKAIAKLEDEKEIDVTSVAKWPSFIPGGAFTAKEADEFDFIVRYAEKEATGKIEVEGPEYLEVAPAEAEVKLGETVTFTVTAVWKDGTRKDVTGEVTWPPEMGGPRFTVSEPGFMVFEVRWFDKRASAKVEVMEPRDLAINPSNVKVKTGEEIVFTTTAVFGSDENQEKPEDVTKLTTFTGAPDGTFMSADPGTFMVKAAYWKLEAIATVEVVGPKELMIEPAETALRIGETVDFVVMALYDDGSLDDVTKKAQWAGAADGTFSAAEPGEHTVVASFGGKNAIATVRVTGLKSVSISPASSEVEVEGTVRFSANATFEDDHSEDVTDRATWTGAPKGKFTAVQQGIFPVTVTFGKKGASATVTVKEKEKESTIDEVVDSLKTDEDKELCTVEQVRAANARLQGLVNDAGSTASKFFMYAAKFDKEISDRAGEPCNNGVVAYCFSQATRIAGQLDAIVDQAKDASTQVLTMKAFCPEAAGSVEGSGGLDTEGVISAVASIGSQRAEVQGRLAAIRARLGEYGCDEDEVEQAGDRYTQEDMDPDMLQDGGMMTEVPGDGVDNDADGLQDEDLVALSGYNITFILFDSGSLKDDIFNLAVGGYGNLGTTPAGGLRSYGLNMPPGGYTATVTVILAPDDVGTFTLVVLENGVEIAASSGVPPQGSSVTVPFTVSGE